MKKINYFALIATVILFTYVQYENLMGKISSREFLLSGILFILLLNIAIWPIIKKKFTEAVELDKLDEEKNIPLSRQRRRQLERQQKK